MGGGDRNDALAGSVKRAPTIRAVTLPETMEGHPAAQSDHFITLGMRTFVAGTVGALLLVVAYVPVRAQRKALRANSATTSAALEAPVVIPFTRGARHLRTLRVRVGADSADSLFDTGGGRTVISPRDSALLGCTPGGRGFGVRLTGEVLCGHSCASVALGVEPFEVTNDAGVLHLATMLGPGAPAVRGMIAFMERPVWTLDPERGRLWVDQVSPITALASDGGAPASVSPASDPVGVYRTTTLVGGHPHDGVMEIRREKGTLVGEALDVGEDDVHLLYDVAMRGDTLGYDIHIPGTVPVRLVFDGATGRGIWGDGGVKRGGSVEMVKVR